MDRKKTNLVVAADVTTKAALLALAKAVGPYICALKTHVDIIEDFDQDMILKLRNLSQEYDFVLFEDRKFADIGNTVMHQCRDGIYKIASWAHIINAHTLPGPGIIEGLKSACANKSSILLLAQMSSKNNLLNDEYTKKTVAMANNYPEAVIGFICQRKISDNPAHIHMTPGVKLPKGAGTDNLGQQYNTPARAIGECGTDIIIVGRGVIAAPDPAIAAKEYQKAGWEAYLESISK